ncbi:hypothetical protein FJO98_15670 [Enterococcus sp. PF-2]|jgi:hypothetical protein|nr:hypothetical protein AL523_13120 [Enterococcus gallinarum]TPE00270.1 hypothetical protein FJP08_16105 [Enterococcus sp. PF-3]TPE23606.1 hypothetical protein FJO98_15670 [Enterococcus sp. PF-2]
MEETNMVKIPVKTTQLPIEIGEHTFHIDISEKGAEAFWKLVAGYAEKSSKITKKVEKEQIKPETAKRNAHEALEKVIDNLLGPGAFDKLFELSPDYMLISEYYMEICSAVSEEIGGRKQQYFEKMQHYLEG